jgi:lysophospholipase L1-like esterase
MHIFFGDSLTAGRLGISYTRFLRELSNCSFRGVDGDTAAGVLYRARSILKSKAPDRLEALVIEGGSNDLLLPAAADSGPAWAAAAAALIKTGREPVSEPEPFIRQLAQGIEALLHIQSLQNAGPKAIAVMTLPLLGENLSSPLNEKKRNISAAVRDLCRSMGLTCIDIEPVLEEAASGGSFFPTDEEPDIFSRDAAFISGSEQRARELSEHRGLSVTTDGLHFNAAGAALTAECITAALRQIG